MGRFAHYSIYPGGAMSLLILGGLLISGCVPQDQTVYQPAVAKLIEQASTFKTQGDPDKAICRLESAAAISPDAYQVHYDLGIMLSESGKYEPAIEHLEKAIQIRPNDPNSRFTVAYTYEQLGDALQVDPGAGGKPLSPELKQANHEKAKHAYEKAAEAYRKFIDVAPKTDPDRKEATNRVTVLTTKLTSF